MIVELVPTPSEAGPLGVAFLAVLQGLTEFLPVSSSGHLVLAQTALGVGNEGLALDVALHLGTLGSVLVVFRRDLGRLLADCLAGRAGLLLALLVGSVPAGLVGVFLDERIEDLFGAPRAVGAFLLGTAALLLFGERARRRRERSAGDVTLGDGLVVGLAQALAILPGLSRSGATISVAMMRGISAERAASFSFLLSIPAIAGAALLKIPEAAREGFGGLAGWVVFGGAVLAGLVGWAALRLLLGTLRRGSFRWFAAYCAVLGAAVLILY